MEDGLILISAEIMPETTITHTTKNRVGRIMNMISNLGAIFLWMGWD